MIHHVVPTLHKELGGVDVAVRSLCGALSAAGEDMMVHTLQAPEEGTLPFPISTYKMIPISPGRLGWSPAMKQGLKVAISQGDIVHNHSLWMMPNVYAGRVARQRCRILINAPHGDLEPMGSPEFCMEKAPLARLGAAEGFG